MFRLASNATTFQVRSIGNSRLTPQQFVAEIEQRCQQAFAQGMERAEQRLANGDRLRFPTDMPPQLQKGLYANEWAKGAVSDFLTTRGIPEGPGQPVALNRWAYDAQGSGNDVRPDVLIDLGPSQRHWIDVKSSFINSGVLPQQLRLFFEYTGSQTGTISTKSGSFSVRSHVVRRRP